MQELHFNFSKLLGILPPIIWRSKWNQLALMYGLPYTRNYMQNLDAEDKGPPKIYFKKRVGYPKESLINWLNTF